jgi:transposase-like protein
MRHRQWTAEQKLAIVLEGIKGTVSVAELCRTHGVNQVQYYKWRDLFLEGAKQRLSGKSSSNGSTEDKVKIKELERIIGKQTVTIEILKKTQELLGT